VARFYGSQCTKNHSVGATDVRCVSGCLLSLHAFIIAYFRPNNDEAASFTVCSVGIFFRWAVMYHFIVVLEAKRL